jgi:hypothetical protein
MYFTILKQVVTQLRDGIGIAQIGGRKLPVMNHSRIRPEYRLIQGNTKEEVVHTSEAFLKEGWVPLYDPIFGRPAAWETKECWSQTLFRAARKEAEGGDGPNRIDGRRPLPGFGSAPRTRT